MIVAVVILVVLAVCVLTVREGRVRIAADNASMFRTAVEHGWKLQEERKRDAD
jgi:hypothetical protein